MPTFKAEASESKNVLVFYAAQHSTHSARRIALVEGRKVLLLVAPHDSQLVRLDLTEEVLDCARGLILLMVLALLEGDQAWHLVGQLQQLQTLAWRAVSAKLAVTEPKGFVCVFFGLAAFELGFLIDGFLLERLVGLSE